MRKNNLLKAGFIAAAMMAFAPAANAADDGVHVGMLQCEVDDGRGHERAAWRDMR